ncbi:glutaredoxin [Fervidicella metallireducens AeB]|uniref:Glutaredoxin n=1 Tax=Fervidicella metallireducens AeB TaxID=1403537 RepID=A0A017RUY0_9CLOT|nr:thioredoxin family protein [Fervidicella metallireducens]EYE88533.1 glutaredoxin [Fervidicella metallireducens AeB]
MKPILIFILKNCPYCRQALSWIDELKKSDAKFNSIPITIIDEKQHPEIADKYDYYYVPTFYVDGKKIHEGAATKEIIKKIFEMALD